MGKLVGLGGYAKAGKDASADLLALDGWIKTYMSAPLEAALLTLNPYVDARWSNWVHGTWPIGPLRYKTFVRYQELHNLVGYDLSKACHDVRGLLQRLGTEVGRNMIDSELWVRLAFENVDRRLESSHVAITGIRYPNELQAIRERDGLAVWIDRPGYGPVNDHSSDNTLNSDDFDVVINNSGSLSNLHKTVLSIVDEFDPARSRAA